VSEPYQTGQQTARKAASILVAKCCGFVVPTARQKQNLVIAFAKRGRVIYGKAFDIVRVSSPISLDDLGEIERNHKQITFYEIKSTRKHLPRDFSKFFFSLTAAEVLVAQSLKDQFRFVFVNCTNGMHLELSLPEIFGRAHGIYPSWSISF
jgi:hypothetical protein